MSGLMAVLGVAEQRAVGLLRSMGAAAPWRGTVRLLALPFGAVGVQQREWGTQAARPQIACHGDVAVAAWGTLTTPGGQRYGAEAARYILAAYAAGELDVARMPGPAAFILWDDARHWLLARRDPLGRRPLFFTSGAELRLASEPKQLRVVASGAHPPAPEMLLRSVGTAAEHAERTYCQGVWRLGGGWLLRGPPHAVTREQYWSPPAVGSFTGTLADAKAALRDALHTALERDAAETEAVLLSGGMDSSAVAAALAGQQPASAVMAITAAYPSSPETDETPWAHAVAERLRMPLRAVQPRPAPFSCVEEDAWRHDGPAMTPFASNFRDLLRRMRGLGFTVAIDGHGGDALFGGCRGLLRALLQRSAMTSLGRVLQVTRRERGWMPVMRGMAMLALPQALRRAASRGRWRARRLPPWLGPAVLDAWAVTDDGASSWENVQQNAARAAAWLELEGVEREALAAGVELLHPLYDERVVELAVALPAEIKMTGGRPKGILRASFAEALPRNVVARRKEGFLDAFFLRCAPAAEVMAALARIEVPRDWLFQPRLRMALQRGELGYSELALVHTLLQAASCLAWS